MKKVLTVLAIVSVCGLSYANENLRNVNGKLEVAKTETVSFTKSEIANGISQANKIIVEQSALKQRLQSTNEKDVALLMAEFEKEIAECDSLIAKAQDDVEKLERYQGALSSLNITRGY